MSICNETLEHLNILDAYYGQMSTQHAEKILNGKKIGTYFFREESDGTLFLSGINQDKEVQHSEIQKKEKTWYGFNGGNHKAADAFALVALCLHCKEHDCISLKLAEMSR